MIHTKNMNNSLSHLNGGRDQIYPHFFSIVVNHVFQYQPEILNGVILILIIFIFLVHVNTCYCETCTPPPHPSPPTCSLYVKLSRALSFLLTFLWLLCGVHTVVFQPVKTIYCPDHNSLMFHEASHHCLWYPLLNRFPLCF